MDRFIPVKRTALDGKIFWVVFDRKNNEYSTLLCFGRYKTKWECQFAIDKYESNKSIKFPK